MDNDQVRAAILEGLAGGLWYDAYACWAEEHGESFSGMEITEVCPEPNEQAFFLGVDLAEGFEVLNGCTLEELLWRAYAADYASRPAAYSQKDAEDFGFCLAMQALGHGISWFDTHAEFELHFPHAESTVDGKYPDGLDFSGWVSYK